MLMAAAVTNSRIAEATASPRETSQKLLLVSEFIQVLTTTDARPRAEEIARALV